MNMLTMRSLPNWRVSCFCVVFRSSFIDKQKIQTTKNIRDKLLQNVADGRHAVDLERHRLFVEKVHLIVAKNHSIKDEKQKALLFRWSESLVDGHRTWTVCQAVSIRARVPTEAARARKRKAKSQCTKNKQTNKQIINQSPSSIITRTTHSAFVTHQ